MSLLRIILRLLRNNTPPLPKLNCFGYDVLLMYTNVYILTVVVVSNMYLKDCIYVAVTTCFHAGLAHGRVMDPLHFHPNLSWTHYTFVIGS